MPAFTFDFVLNGAATIEADDAETARAMLIEALRDSADCNGGSYPNGDPVLFEASLFERPRLAMIDGEELEAPEPGCATDLWDDVTDAVSRSYVMLDDEEDSVKEEHADLLETLDALTDRLAAHDKALAFEA